MHKNNNYQCKMCCNKTLTFGVGSIKTQFSYHLCSPNTCKDVFNPNVITFKSNCAEDLHFSAFHYYNYVLILLFIYIINLLLECFNVKLQRNIIVILVNEVFR